MPTQSVCAIAYRVARVNGLAATTRHGMPKNAINAINPINAVNAINAINAINSIAVLD